MKRLAAFLLMLVLLTGCAPKQVSTTVFAMDTVMKLSVYGDEAVLDEAEALIHQLEAQVSVTREGSELYSLNHTGSGTVTGHAKELLDRALALCSRTDGALDISIYPVVRSWGFTTGEYRVPDEDALASLLSHVDYKKIDFDASSGAVSLSPDMEIDLGSVTKGYLSSCLIALFRENGITSALVNLGGNVQALGTKPDGSLWQVAVQDPKNDSYLGVLSIADQAVITSGGYERYFEEDGKTYWHIIDPATGAPAQSGLISVTIVGTDGTTCDALSTALFVMGLENAADFWTASDDFEAIFVTEDDTVYITEGLQDSFTLSEDHSKMELQVITRD